MNDILDNITFRHVKQQDKPFILAFTSNTWGVDTDDYIDDVFEAWVREENSFFITAVLDNIPIAISRIVNLGEGEFWLEGLRVDPNYRGLGIGRVFHNHNISLVQSVGGKILRYATGQDNLASQHLALQTGFIRIGIYRRYEKAPVKADEILESIETVSFPELVYEECLYQYRWKWQKLSFNRLSEHILRGEVFGYRENEKIEGWMIVVLEEGELEIIYLTGKNERTKRKMINMACEYAWGKNYKVIFSRIEENSPLVTIFSDLRFVSSEYAFWIYELNMEQTYLKL